MTATDQANEQPRSKRTLRFSLAGLLFVVLCVAGVFVGARVGQQRLRLRPALQMTVTQRFSKASPGLRGLAHLALDDFTNDAVILHVQDNLGSDLIAPASVRERDVPTPRPNPICPRGTPGDQPDRLGLRCARRLCTPAEPVIGASCQLTAKTCR